MGDIYLPGTLEEIRLSVDIDIQTYEQINNTLIKLLLCIILFLLKKLGEEWEHNIFVDFLKI